MQGAAKGDSDVFQVTRTNLRVVLPGQQGRGAEEAVVVSRGGGFLCNG